MGEVIEYVAVERPTALDILDPPIMKLSGQDLWTMYIKNVHVLPDRLDMDKFKLALSRTIPNYPHVGGRLKRSGDEWMIELKNLPVPVIVVDRDSEEGAKAVGGSETVADAFPFASTFVLQPMPDLGPFEPDVIPFLAGNEDVPLLYLKITFWKHKTILSVSWNHTLGDIRSMFDFTKHLSELYQDLDAPESRLPPKPFFHREIYSSRRPVDAETARRLEDRMPHLINDEDQLTLWNMHGKMWFSTEEIQIRLHGDILDELLRRAREDGQTDIRLTTQDALTAYLVTVMNQCLETPIRRVVSTLNTRAPAHATSYPPFAHPNASSNCVLKMYSDEVPVESILSIPTIAQAVRRSIIEGRKPEFVDLWTSFASEYMLKSANAGRKQWFIPKEGVCMFNSQYRYDWNDCHFGFKGRTYFYCSWTTERYFRVFRSNTGAEGTSSKGTESADVVFRVKKGVKEKFIGIIKAEFPNVDVDEA